MRQGHAKFPSFPGWAGASDPPTSASLVTPVEVSVFHLPFSAQLLLHITHTWPNDPDPGTTHPRGAAPWLCLSLSLWIPVVWTPTVKTHRLTGGRELQRHCASVSGLRTSQAVPFSVTSPGFFTSPSLASPVDLHGPDGSSLSSRALPGGYQERVCGGSGADWQGSACPGVGHSRR